MWKSAGAKAAGCIIGILVCASLAFAVDINGYSSTHNDRFSSGYPTVPIANTNSNFIGLGYDLSGIGWNASNPAQSVALLGPQFFLYGNHYYPGTSLQFSTGDGQVKTYSISAISGGLGPNSTSDLAVGVLSSPIPASDHIAYYSILFLGYSPSSYISTDNNIFVYGHQSNGSTNGPAIGAGAINSVSNGLWINENGTSVFHSGYYFSFPYSPPGTDTATLTDGDSGSPSFFYSSQTHSLYLAGAHYAVGGGFNYDSALPMMLNYVNAYMAQTGYLPYVVTPPTATWSGTLNGSWGIGGAGGNWSGSGVPADVLTVGQKSQPALQYSLTARPPCNGILLSTATEPSLVLPSNPHPAPMPSRFPKAVRVR